MPSQLQRTHPLVSNSRSKSIEDFVLELIHRKAYEHAIEVATGKSLLDWGCNDGYGMEMMRAFAREIAGLDVAEQAIQAARRRLPELKNRIRLYDGFRTPFPTESVDVVTSFQVVEHVSEYEPYFSGVWRVLKRGGVGLFTTPNRNLRLEPGMKPWNPFHVREFNAQELEQLLRPWFSAVEIRGMHAMPEIEAIERRRCEHYKRVALSPPALHSVIRSRFCRLLARLQRGIRPESGCFQPGRNLISDRFSTNELFYTTDRLDDALDLMAVCWK
jgi:SAM-dependent methyltransferase